MKGYGYSFHDTVTGDEPVDQYEAKAKKQDDLILDFFRTHAGYSYTPFQILEQIKWPSTPPPITSVRRAITNLETKGELKKLEEKKKGRYGKNNHTWTKILTSKQGYLF